MKELLEALVSAQAEFPSIPRNHTGQVGPRKYAYADLGDIEGAIRPVLTAHGLFITHQYTDSGLLTVLHHIPTGQTLESFIPIDYRDSSQVTGSQGTYARRYNVSALVNLVTEEDIDGAGQSSRRPQPTRSPSDPPPQRVASTQASTVVNDPPPQRQPAQNTVAWAKPADLKAGRFWTAGFRAAEEAYGQTDDNNKFEAIDWVLREAGIASKDHIPLDMLQGLVHRMASFPDHIRNMNSVPTEGIGDGGAPAQGQDDVPF